MAGVLPEYQNRGAGRMLKLCQREEALRAGVARIQWTFDSLELRNAYFNICRLGVVIRHYIPNCYGHSTSPLHGDLPTDRAVAEWHLNSARVVSAVHNEAPPDPSLNPIKIPIPANIGELKKADPSQACQVQAELRLRLQDLFSSGYAIIGFDRGSDTCHYLLERYED
jgi:predicted GNAT superfamily acetyltransferase